MILGIDVWEGSLDIDEGLLLADNVKFVIPRLNSMDGGHHMDTTFTAQWEQAEGFLRAPYFVYNPWVSGKENADWLIGHLPLDAPLRVFCDIEVRYPDYPPLAYAEQVWDFIGILKDAGFMPCIYTGYWFLPFLSYWPKDVDYWWARYPFYLYPEVSTPIRWPDLAERIDYVGWHPDDAGYCPGTVKLWQCSADRYIPTGTYRTTDINVWNGTLEELESWWGAKFPGTITAPTLDRVRVSYTGGLNIRSAPIVATNIIGGAYYGSTWTAMGRVKDALGREWVQVGPSAYIAGWYTTRA
jgi:GH25 family lysozyme M1 (1,4-beta-N-acetylmuramidase)